MDEQLPCTSCLLPRGFLPGRSPTRPSAHLNPNPWWRPLPLLGPTADPGRLRGLSTSPPRPDPHDGYLGSRGLSCLVQTGQDTAGV